MFRLLSFQDVDRLAELLQDRELIRNLKSVPYPYSREAAVLFVRQVRGQQADLPPLGGLKVRGKTCWALQCQGQLAGVIGVTLGNGAEQGDFTVGYWLGRAYWGRGLATLAVREVCRWAFEVAGARRITANVFSWNPASARVLEKNGFVKEGCKRQAIIRFGEVADLWIYGLLPSDSR